MQGKNIKIKAWPKRDPIAIVWSDFNADNSSKWRKTLVDGFPW